MNTKNLEQKTSKAKKRDLEKETVSYNKMDKNLSTQKKMEEETRKKTPNKKKTREENQ